MENYDIVVDLFQKTTMEEGAADIAKVMKSHYDAFISVGFTVTQALSLTIEMLRSDLSTALNSIDGGKGK